MQILFLLIAGFIWVICNTGKKSLEICGILLKFRLTNCSKISKYMLTDLDIMTSFLFRLFVGKIVGLLLMLAILHYMNWGIAFLDCFNARGRDCYEVANQTVCYFQPNEKYINVTWDDAWKVCKENNSTLPVIDNRMLAETLRRHLQSRTSLSPEMWLAGREIRTNVWQWLNGRPFGKQNLFGNTDDVQKLYYTNAVITRDLKYMFMKSYARNTKYHICHYDDSKPCQNVNVINWKNGCLFVNNDKALNLVDARNRCLDEGGDLATFEEDEDLHSLREDSSLFIKNREYWIGLRLNWWIWNETDSSKEIKYSNWAKYENRLNEECLYSRLIDYKWNQSSCKSKKPFICQTVTTIAKETGVNGLDASTSDWFSQSNSTSSQGASPIDLKIAIIIGAIAVVLVVIVTVVLVIAMKRTTNKRISHPPDEKPTIPYEISTQQIQNKSVKSNTIEVDEVSNHYAEITRVNHEHRIECRDESQSGIVYATLEFDANKAIYEEPITSSQRKQEARASRKVGPLNGNGQPGSSAESPTQAAEGTTYANM